VAAAGHIFKLSRQGEDGASYGAKLEHLAKTTGRRPAALDGPPIPKAVKHVWGWFKELRAGQDPITYLEISAWAGLTGNRPTPEEVRLIKRLDTVYLNSLGDGK